MAMAWVMRRLVTALTILLVLSLAGHEAAGQTTPTESRAALGDRAAAQALFDQAVELRDANRLKEACSKFEESLRLDPGVGTRFNLADCFVRMGRFASAWTHFLEVAAATEMAGQHDRAEIARKRADVLVPRLSKLRIVPEAPVGGLEIKRNGVLVGSAQWNTPVPTDPGQHEVVASAPGYKPWSTQFNVVGEGRVSTLQIPPLIEAPDPPPGAAPGYPADSGVSAAGTAGLVIAAVGLIGVGVGVGFGVVALDKKSEVDELCPDLDRCTQAGIDANNDGKTAGTVSTIGLAAGGALLVGGMILFLATSVGDDQADSAQLVITPIASSELAGIAVVGSF
jgi:hypothetical protein